MEAAALGQLELREFNSPDGNVRHDLEREAPQVRARAFGVEHHVFHSGNIQFCSFASISSGVPMSGLSRCCTDE